MSATEDVMTRAEREDLAKLVRRYEKLAKVDADSLAAERLAVLEAEFATTYRIDDQQVWAEANAAAQEAVAEANERVAERCRELGIREIFAPRISATWHGRGESDSRVRVAELRKVAKARFDAEAKRVKFEVERASVAVQTQLIAGGLRSAEARAFLEGKPTAEALMPTLTLAELEAGE